MQRRKFIVGLGSLAAGASVTMGTGALSATEANRNLTGKLADDSKAYVSMYAANANGHYVTEDAEDEKIALDFGEIGDGNGLNRDAISYFDTVFHIAIPDGVEEGDGVSPSDYEVWFTRNIEASYDDRITFYRGDNRNATMVNAANRRPMSSANSEFARIDVGVEIDLTEGEFAMPLDKCDDLNDAFGLDDGDELFTVHVDNKAAANTN